MADPIELPHDLVTLVEFGREQRGLEYKQSLEWDQNAVKIKLTKSCMAMSNLRDGGDIVIGVEDDTFRPVGMAAHDFESFTNDHVADFLNQYAEPAVELQVIKGSVETRLFVVIRVSPFSQQLTICRREGGDGTEKIYKGEIYIRPPGKPETRRVETAAEMRELIEISVEREMERMRRLAPEAFALPPDHDDALTVELEEFGD